MNLSLSFSIPNIACVLREKCHRYQRDLEQLYDVPRKQDIYKRKKKHIIYNPHEITLLLLRKEKTDVGWSRNFE